MKPIAAAAILALLSAGVPARPAQDAGLATNKDRIISVAVQGRVAPASATGAYLVTWDGRPKMPLGVGGINYNLRVGDPVFGWAGGDRATMGVATVGAGNNPYGDAWLGYTAIGNEARILGGEARGKTGRIVGKFQNYVLLQFEPAVTDQLAVGDLIQVKSEGVGLEVQGLPEVLTHGVSPALLEKIAVRRGDRLEVAVVKEIPADLVGGGAGGSGLTGNWHIQTCYPPDVAAYGLDTLRFGDIVLLKDTQTDYGKGYYKGGATVGVVCSGPSDISGLGIGVTPILSTRSPKLAGRIDPGANIGAYFGWTVPPAPVSKAAADAKARPTAVASRVGAQAAPGALRTNKDALIETAVEGVVQAPGMLEYNTTFDGRPQLGIGMAGINYRVSVGDPASGWADTDHVEPDVTIQGRDQQSPMACAVAVLSCIGNEARVLTGDARGAKGYYLGRHAGSDDKVWFPADVKEKMALNDVVQVRARGVGLRIEGFDDVRVNKLSPELLEKIAVVENGNLVVPVVMEVPGFLMGSGIGGSGVEAIDYDVQTTCPEAVASFDLKKLRLGDLVAIRDHYDAYGRGRYAGAVTIGTVIHGFSQMSGHGPGLNPVLSARTGRLRTRIDPDANLAYLLGIKPKPAR